MISLTQEWIDLINGHELGGLYWLAEILLPSGTQYFSDTKDIDWDGHSWVAMLDPDNPIGDLQQSLQLDQKNDCSIHLCNVGGPISALLRANDVESRTCRIYLYSDLLEDALMVYRGVCGKPDGLKEGVVEIPVIPLLHGPRVRLPGERASNFCRFATGMFADAHNCLYDPANNYGCVDPDTGLPFASCPGTRQACADRGMMSITKPAPWDGSGDPSPWCNFAGFVKFQGVDRGHYKSGMLGIGRTDYSSKSTWSENFLGGAIPLVYGEVRIKGNGFYAIDENDFFLAGAILSDGQCQGADPNKVWLNGSLSHAGSIPYFAHGWIGQRRPNYFPTSDTWGPIPDGYAGTCYVALRVNDERGIQPGREADIEAIMQGRLIQLWYKVGDDWMVSGHYWTDEPIQILADMICSGRGGLNLGYDVMRPGVLDEMFYSLAEITDVDTVVRKRYTANGAVLDSQTAGEVLERFRKEFGLYFRLYADTLDWGFIKPGLTSVMTFSHALHNILPDDDGASTVEVKEKGAEDIPNRLYISFLDKDNSYEKTTFHLESKEQLDKVGKIIDESLYLGWTTNIGQALRIGSNIYQKMIEGNYTASWQSDLQALAVEVGDVVLLVSEHLPGGQQTMLITEKVLTWDFGINLTAELYRDAFYDDTIAAEYSDSVREPPTNQLRLPENVAITDAWEIPHILDGKRYSDVTVTYVPPADDVLWNHVETWWHDEDNEPDTVWHFADESSGGTSNFRILGADGENIAIRLVSVSRYGISHAPDNPDNPEILLTLHGTTDADAPTVPLNLAVHVFSDSQEVPVGTFRIEFDRGASNWESVSAVRVQVSGTLPFGTPLLEQDFLFDPGNPSVIAGHFKLDIQYVHQAVYFRVRGRNIHGDGAWATTVSAYSSYEDAGRPGAPSGIVVSVDGNAINASWIPPTVNFRGLLKYTLKVTTSEYQETGGVYTFAACNKEDVPPSQTSGTIRVSVDGKYRVGVTATNIFGESDMGILWEECP